MPSYAGFDLGLVFEMNTVPAPKARQITGYPGVNGLQCRDLGSRGGYTTVAAALGASTPGGLGLLIQGLRSLQQAGGESILIDEFGVAWPSVILDQFAPTGRIYTGPAGFFKKYEAIFFHRI